MTGPTTYEHTNADGTPVVLEAGVMPGVVYVQVGDPFAGPGALVPVRDLLGFALAACGITRESVQRTMLGRDSIDGSRAVWAHLTGEDQS